MKPRRFAGERWWGGYRIRFEEAPTGCISSSVHPGRDEVSILLPLPGPPRWTVRNLRGRRGA